MKVAFFIDDITKDGGTERCTTVLSNLLNCSGLDVSILSINASKKRSKYEISPNVIVKMFNSQKIENAVSRRMRTFKYLGYEILRGGYDVIIVVDTYKSLCFIPFIPLLKKKKTKLISWEHFNYNFGEKHSPRWWGRRVAARISDAVVVLSKADYEAWKADFKLQDRLKQIYNFPCFDLERPMFDADCKTVLAVGRLEEQKGFDYLLDIWKLIEIDEELNDWKLQIVGSGSLEQKLHEKEKTLGLNRVQRLQFTEHIEEIYKNASIYVMTSRFEGFALVLLGAKAFGLPIVSFDIKNGSNEIVQNGVDGYIVSPFDVNMLTDKLKMLMKNDIMREQFTKHSQSNMDQFSKKKIVGNWIQLLEEIIE